MKLYTHIEAEMKEKDENYLSWKKQQNLLVQVNSISFYGNMVQFRSNEK